MLEAQLVGQVETVVRGGNCVFIYPVHEFYFGWFSFREFQLSPTVQVELELEK